VKFLAISTNLADPTPHIPAEIARTTELMEAGVLEQALLKADRSGAVLVLDVPDGRRRAGRGRQPPSRPAWRNPV
jgi:hypothetical protein